MPTPLVSGWLNTAFKRNFSFIEVWPMHFHEHLTVLAWPTLWREVLVEELTVATLVKKFRICYATQMFIALWKTPSHISWSRTTWILLSSSIHVSLVFINIIITDVPRSPKLSFPLRFRDWQFVSCFFYHPCYMSASLESNLTISEVWKL